MFEVGKIYACQYMNAKHDPSPTLLVFNADNKYVEGLNINYLSRYEQKSFGELLMRYGEMFKDINLTGVMMYKIMKRDVYQLVKKAYRKYHFHYIRGYLVSNGMKQGAVEVTPPERVLHTNDEFVKYMNRILNPDVMTLEKAEMQPKREQMNEIMGDFREWWESKL